MTKVIIVVAIWLCLIYLYTKNINTADNRRRVCDAIFLYNSDCIKNGTYDYKKSDDLYNSLESYGKTLLRFWDWGCKKIVPAEVWEKIEPYM